MSDLVCEDEGVKSPVSPESEELDLETTTHREINERKDIQPHRVRLPLGYHYTEKQRSRVLTITDGFLDLKTYNETMAKFTPGQSYTWAFPSEKFAKEFMRKKRKPKIYRMKKTESKLQKIIEAAD